MTLPPTRFAWALTLLASVNVSCQQGEPQAAATSSEERAALPAPAQDTTVRLSPEAAKHAGLELHQAGSATIEEKLVFQGDVGAIPERLAAIVARLDGLVTAVQKKEGDPVKKGEAMVTLDSKRLAEAKLDYLESEHGLEFATAALEREEQLMERRISSKEQYQRALHDKEAAELNHAAALQRLRVLGFSEAGLHSLEENPTQPMTNFTLRAPFAGEVIEKDVTLGQAIAADATLFRLADLSELQVEIRVPLPAAQVLKPGAAARVICANVGLEATGAVTYVASMADTATRTVPVRISFSNAEGTWRPGMPARVELVGAVNQAKVAIPVEAIHDLRGKPTAFVDLGKGRFRPAALGLGAKDDKFQEVLSGIESGDRVAAKNSLVLKSESLKAGGE